MWRQSTTQRAVVRRLLPGTSPTATSSCRTPKWNVGGEIGVADFSSVALLQAVSCFRAGYQLQQQRRCLVSYAMQASCCWSSSSSVPTGSLSSTETLTTSIKKSGSSWNVTLSQHHQSHFQQLAYFSTKAKAKNKRKKSSPSKQKGKKVKRQVKTTRGATTRTTKGKTTTTKPTRPRTKPTATLLSTTTTTTTNPLLDEVSTPGQAQQILCRQKVVSTAEFRQLVSKARPGNAKDADAILYCLKHMKINKQLILTVQAADEVVTTLINCMMGDPSAASSSSSADDTATTGEQQEDAASAAAKVDNSTDSQNVETATTSKEDDAAASAVDNSTTSQIKVDTATTILQHFDDEDTGLFYSLSQTMLEKVMSILWEGVQGGGVMKAVPSKRKKSDKDKTPKEAKDDDDDSVEFHQPLLVLLHRVICKLNFRSSSRAISKLKKRAARKYNKYIQLKHGTTPTMIHLATQTAMTVVSKETVLKKIVIPCVRRKRGVQPETLELVGFRPTVAANNDNNSIADAIAAAASEMEDAVYEDDDDDDNGDDEEEEVRNEAASESLDEATTDSTTSTEAAKDTTESFVAEETTELFTTTNDPITSSDNNTESAESLTMENSNESLSSDGNLKVANPEDNKPESVVPPDDAKDQVGLQTGEESTK